MTMIYDCDENGDDDDDDNFSEYIFFQHFIYTLFNPTHFRLIACALLLDNGKFSMTLKIFVFTNIWKLN